MTDEDDYITVNITRDQSAALTMILMQATKMGIVDVLPRREQRAFVSFVKMMTMEIDRQKLNALGNTNQ